MAQSFGRRAEDRIAFPGDDLGILEDLIKPIYRSGRHSHALEGCEQIAGGFRRRRVGDGSDHLLAVFDAAGIGRKAGGRLQAHRAQAPRKPS